MWRSLLLVFALARYSSALGDDDGDDDGEEQRRAQVQAAYASNPTSLETYLPTGPAPPHRTAPP